ncbi:MAG: hypothetical protein HZA31_05160 [Opitutae bacterium]|nr:hypothetical protein [Opitutae bacterium]
MRTDRLPPQMEMPAELALALFEAAAATARAAARVGARVPVARRTGATLRPGPATPLWNELARQARPLLARRGEKAKLARLLGVPRQRVNDYLRATQACPDAERTLLLLCWVARRQQGKELGG